MRLAITLSLMAFITLFIPQYVFGYQCDILTPFSEAIYCGDPVEINVELENVDESCLVDPLECTWMGPEGMISGNSISVNTPGTYTAQITDCAGCVSSKQITVSDETLDGGSLINGISLNFCTGDGTDDIILAGTLAIQNATGPFTQLLVIDYSGQILFIPNLISEINWDILGEGQLLIINIAYGENLEGLEIGSNIWSDLTGCNDKSNPLYVNLESCQGPGLDLPEVIPLTATETSVTVYWDEDLAPPSQVTFQYKTSSETVWNSIIPTDNFIILNSLMACTVYQMRLMSDDQGVFTYGNTSYIETAGCAVCPEVNNLFGFNFSSSTAFLTWDVVVDANYKFNYKDQNSSDWITYETSYPITVLFGLNPCSYYDWYIEAECYNVDIPSSSAIATIQTSCKEAENDIPFIHVKISPNPSSDLFQISTVEPMKHIEVIDYTGKVHYSKSLNDIADFSLNLGHLQSGSYFVKTLSSSGNSITPIIKD